MAFGFCVIACSFDGDISRLSLHSAEIRVAVLKYYINKEDNSDIHRLRSLKSHSGIQSGNCFSGSENRYSTTFGNRGKVNK